MNNIVVVFLQRHDQDILEFVFIKYIGIFFVHANLLDDAEGVVQVEIEVRSATEQVIEANRTIRTVEFFQRKGFVLSSIVTLTKLFQTPRVLVIHVKRQQFEVFMEVGMVGLRFQKAFDQRPLMFQSDQLFIIAVFEEIVTAEIVSVQRDFLEVCNMEIIPFKRLQVGHPHVPLGLGDRIVFRDTVQELENGEILRFLADKNNELLEFFLVDTQRMLFFVVLLHHFARIVNDIILIQDDLVVSA